MSKIAYFDCFSGISGDMIIGALLDAGLDFKQLQNELAKLDLSNYEITVEKIVKNHIASSKFEVIRKDEKSYRHLKNLNDIVEKSRLAEEIKTTAKKIFLKIAEAEAKIHHLPIEKVHFHEIGAVDTIVDVVGALSGLKLLGIEKIYCSRLNVGSGFVEFSHGRFPVPAPAAAEILKGIPIFATDSNAELVTPTGAAIISSIAEQFGELPAMITEAIGYGAGTRDLPHPNLLRLYIGALHSQTVMDSDAVAIIETNIDDMNPQLYEHVLERLLANGALDAFLTPVMMKKNRPGIQITVLASLAAQNQLINLLFEETSTIGVRFKVEHRKVLAREIQEMDTKFGKVKFKLSRLGDKVMNAVPEYEDCKRIAREFNLPLKQVLRELKI